MKSSYKKIGEYIRLVDQRNNGLKVSLLLGLTISKKFIPSVANVIGTDMENYKIIREHQFACSLMQVRRDGKMPVALLQDFDEAIISQAYPVFEIIDENKLLPEYLMMWFSREEFDREACFYAVGGVRGSLEWEDFCNMGLPIPNITKQQEIIDEYNVIKNRIILNETIITKLEDTAQALYRQWFVDYGFPDSDGKPYKSNGGEMEYCKEIEKEVPKGWGMKRLRDFCDFQNGYSYTSDELKDSNIGMVTIKNFNKKGGYKAEGIKEIIPIKDIKNKTVSIFDVLVAHTDLTQGIIIGMPIIILNKSKYNELVFSMDTVKVVSKYPNISNSFFYFILKQNNFHEHAIGYVNGSTVMHLSKNALIDYSTLLPNESILMEKLDNLLFKILLQQSNLFQENESLCNMKDLILAKMASVG